MRAWLYLGLALAFGIGMYAGVLILAWVPMGVCGIHPPAHTDCWSIVLHTAGPVDVYGEIALFSVGLIWQLDAFRRVLRTRAGLK